MGRKREISRSEVRKLHEKGLNDYEIAKKLNCHRLSVGNIRREIGLESSQSISREVVRRLHKKGLTDPKIAEKLSCSRTGVGYVRRELGLKPNWSMSVISREMVRKLYNKGLADSEIAMELKCSSHAVWIIRNRELGLRTNRPNWKNIDCDKLWEDYQSGMQLDELAEKYGYKTALGLKRVIGRIYLERKQE